MADRLGGLHHVSALSAHIGRTHGFYTRVLGMRPVIKTVNQDEPSMYHLFYADGEGRPGTEMTVFDMPHAARERPGNNSISRTTFRVWGEDVFAYWTERLDREGVARGEVRTRDGRRTLDFEDGEGTRLALVDDGGVGDAVPWVESPVPVEHQIRGLGHIEITVPSAEPTERFLLNALGLEGVRAYPVEDAPGYEVRVYRMDAEGPQSEVHVVVRDDLPQARYGAGGVHHVALRIPEGQRIETWRTRLDIAGYRNSGIVDRHYFTSIYVREPNGVLFELATDGPGFQVGGPLDADTLKLPPFLEPRRAEIEANLKPLG